MLHNALPAEPTRDELLAWYRRGRARTREIFDLVAPEAYYDRPITLRNPIVFYEGHLPAFAVNTLVKRTYGRPGIDARLEVLFARGIDPEDETAVSSPSEVWPSREEVHAYADAADALIEETLVTGDEATLTILEHELMHQETLLYMLHELPYGKKSSSRLVVESSSGGSRRVVRDWVRVPAGRVTMGQDARFFGWDNEFPALSVDVDAFSIETHNVTNGAYLEYMQATGAAAPHFWARGSGGEWCWRGMFSLMPLLLDAPVYVTHDEAAAYARWNGARLPTEAEYDRAWSGGLSAHQHLGRVSREPGGLRAHPSTEAEGNFDFQHYEPVAVGSYAPNDLGIYDLVGNGWEWTSTIFAPFPGFKPMAPYPEYSADFFDDAHYVLKGASPATARELIRPSFRNWFRPAYPYVYATFRCAR